MKPIGGLRGVIAILLLMSAAALAQSGTRARQDAVPYLRGVHPTMSADLPDLGDATVYRLDWTLDGTQLTATEEVRVTNYSAEAWHELYFLLLPNRIGGRMTVGDLQVNGEAVSPGFAGDETVMRVDLPVQLKPGEAATVKLDYRLAVPETGGGNYGILALDEGVLSLAHAYALLAVHDSEGWDVDLPPRYGDLVYARSSFFRVRLDAPASLGVAASGDLIEWNLEGGRQIVEFAAGPVRDFYLAAGEEWEQIVRAQDGVTVRAYARPENRALMERAVETALRSLSLFGDLYGHYPFRELDLVPITTSALGVEFPGIIAIRRELIEEDQRILLESTVAHEVGHQWFYSLVGNDQVSEPWLDESVTQYLTMRYYREVYGEPGYRLFRQGLLERWEQIGRNRLPIGLPVGRYSGSEYGAVIYGLGPLVVERLAQMVGDSTFDGFINDYVERNAFGIATTLEFRQLAEEHCDCSLQQFFEEWVLPRPSARR
ncbi:MAG TPA: M1 family metallopeptidase [Trueperaceae bacterium]